MRNPNAFYSYRGYMYGPGIPGRTVADLELLLAPKSGTGSPDPAVPVAPIVVTAPVAPVSESIALVEPEAANAGDPVAPAAVPAVDYKKLSLQQLWTEAKARNIRPTGTGKNGSVTKADLVMAISDADRR